MRKIIGYLLIALSIMICVTVVYRTSRYSSVNRPFSSHTILTSSWEKYKEQFILPEGRVVDYTQQEITTSEGQSYALLRAVWVDDKDTFDRVWKWTQDNLRRDDDKLFGWKWGKLSNGTYNFLEDGGNNNASDADEDIALALIFAGRRWGDEKYINSAKEILADLWKYNVGETKDNKNYLVAGNWAKSQDILVINPSYFAPYAWRIFAQVDKERDWNSLIDPAYDLLEEVRVVPLDTQSPVGLPPDWISLYRSDGSIKPTYIDRLTTNYSFDAIRTPWRIALDYQWNQEERAFTYLANAFSFLESEYNNEGKLAGSYSRDGKRLSGENATMYATSLGYFMIVKPDLAKKIYEDKIIKLYSNDNNTFREDVPYYEQNWLWFGTALYNNGIKPI